MDTNTADKIKLRLGELRAKALKSFDRQMWGIYPVNDAINVSMVHEGVRAAEENTSRLLPEAVAEVLALSESPDAFLLVHDAMAGHLLDLERRIEQGRGIPLRPGALKVAGERFAAVRQRSYQSLENYRSSFSGSKNKGGRPSGKGWEDALIHVIAIANTPDGLPTERGAQAHIEKIIGEWFMRTTGDSPADATIRERARDIVKAISKPQKAGN